MLNVTESATLNRSAAECAQLIASKGFLDKMYQGMAAQQMDIQIDTDTDDAFAAKVIRIVNLKEKAPGFAKGLVSEAMEVTHSHQWQKTEGTPQGKLEITFEGMPGELNADMQLRDSGDGQCELVIDGNLEVRIRLIGGRLEKFLGGVVSDRFQALLTAAQEHVEAS